MTYFTPSIEDIRVGYECEIATPADVNWESYIWDYVTLSKHNFNHESPLFALTAKLRVPYLTKEQIEAEGWRQGNSRILFSGSNGYWDYTFTKDNYILYYDTGNKILSIIVRDPSLEGSNFIKMPVFRGECKDINTFKFICKLLKIN